MKRLIAIVLLFAFMAGQFNLTWAEHFCGVFKVKSTLTMGQSHLDCGMGDMEVCDNYAHGSQETRLQSSDCCKTQYISSDSDDFFNKENSKTHDLNLFTPLVEEIRFAGQSDISYPVRYQFYAPSSDPPDRCVLYCTFLI